ncbi:hypothetical protein ACFQ3S_11795 [Mucilaginibacter terrae]|uniref:hypothetical protein n=1 Tax=Mucilaginibacter terrae TaxID=1955052 RepID=UPI00362FD88F
MLSYILLLLPVQSLNRAVTAMLTAYFLFNLAPLSAQTVSPTYPKIAAYVGILQPLITFGSYGTHVNFSGSYTVGIPTGINICKRAENGISKMNNFLFHTGVLIALEHGYTIAGRAPF